MQITDSGLKPQVSDRIFQDTSYRGSAGAHKQSGLRSSNGRRPFKTGLKATKGPTWGTCKLQFKGALSLCTEVLSSSADFHADFHCACPWVVLLRTQPESREPAGLDPADISLWAESQPINNHRKVQRDASLCQVWLWLQNWNCRQTRNYPTPP